MSDWLEDREAHKELIRARKEKSRAAWIDWLNEKGIKWGWKNQGIGHAAFFHKNVRIDVWVTTGTWMSNGEKARGRDSLTKYMKSLEK